MHLQEPVVTLVLLEGPVPEVLPRRPLLLPPLPPLLLSLPPLRAVRLRLVVVADLGLLEAFLLELGVERVLVVSHGRAGINSTD